MMMTETLAQFAIFQNKMAYYAACLYGREFSVYVAANYGSLFARQYGLGYVL